MKNLTDIGDILGDTIHFIFFFLIDIIKYSMWSLKN